MKKKGQKMQVKMSDLKKGESAVIKSLSNPSAMRRRLIDIGFSEGSVVTLVCHAPFSDPSAYSIKGSIIALRRQDACLITVEKEDK